MENRIMENHIMENHMENHEVTMGDLWHLQATVRLATRHKLLVHVDACQAR